MIIRFFFYSVISVVLFTFTTYAEETFGIEKQDTLIVGVAGTQPFYMVDSITNEYEGIALNIWDEISTNMGWNFKYKPYPTVKDALAAVKQGKIDIAVGPISITSDRVKNLHFSQPYYNSSLTIASRMEDGGWWASIKPFFSLKLLYAVGGFLLILAFVGSLLWVAEHKTNPDEFSQKPGKGIGNGMWLAIVTMSTVGYGDMAPKTAFGRIIAGTWIVLAIIFATSMVAGIASVLTISSMGSTTITNVEQLAGKKTATIKGSPAVSFIAKHQSKIVTVESLEKAMMLLKNKKVDAVVYDQPQLLYYQKKHRGEDIYVAKAEYYKQGYGFAFHKGDTLVYEVNKALLKLAEKQEVKSIVTNYLGDQNLQ